MNEQLSRIWNHPAKLPLLSFGIGLGLGYILGRKSVKKISYVVDIHKIPETSFGFDHEKVEEFVKEQKKIKVKEIIVPNPDQDQDQDQPPPRELRLAPESTEWSYEEELKHRTTSEPHVIHKDEFWGEELGYTQSTFTYYAGDNILVDEDDTPIYNHDSIVGPMMFGHGSGDPNVFYVRNDKRKGEYEILYDPGLYSVEVLGLNIENNQRAREVKHSGHVRKFKME